jgi:hypothetical protein
VQKRTAARKQGLVVTTVEPALLPGGSLFQPGGTHNDSSRNSLVPTENILAVAIAPPCLKCFHALRHSTDSMPHTAAPSQARTLSFWLGWEQAPENSERLSKTMGQYWINIDPNQSI